MKFKVVPWEGTDLTPEQAIKEDLYKVEGPPSVLRVWEAATAYATRTGEWYYGGSIEEWKNKQDALVRLIKALELLDVQ